MPLRRISAYSYEQGLTLAELLVVVVILGITAAVGSVGLTSLTRRERLNATALEVSGWIEQVRNQASNQINQDDSLGGCTVSFNKSLVNATAGVAIAALTTGSSCPNLSSSNLAVPSARSAKYNICSSSATSCTASSSITDTQDIAFTPRGMIRATPSLGSSAIFEYRIVLSDGRGPKRCVRISDITGTVDIGYGSDSNLASSCSTYGSL